MKYYKYEFISPVSGFVMCDALDFEQHSDRKVPFDEQGAWSIFFRSSQIEEGMNKRIIDLVDSVSDRLKGNVVRAIFGKTCYRDDGLYFLTEIYTRYKLSIEDDMYHVMSWIEDEMCNGWGERYNERAVWEERVPYYRVNFDKEKCEFSLVQEDDHAVYYITPQDIHGNWNGTYLDMEEVELDDIPDNSEGGVQLVKSFALDCVEGRGQRLVNVYAGNKYDMEKLLWILEHEHGLNVEHQLQTFENPQFCDCRCYYIAVYHQDLETGIYPNMAMHDVETGYEYILEDTGEIIQTSLDEMKSRSEFDADVASWFIKRIIFNHH